VSGSSNFYIDQKFTDSLAGRKRLFELNSLSFKEFLIFKDRNDFADYLNAGTIPLLYKNEMQRMMMEYILYGGYPEVVVSESYDEKKVILDELANSYVKKDALEAKLNNPELYFQILQILAYQSGSLTNVSEIGRDLKTTSQTIENYIKVMKMAFQVTQIHPFSRNIATEIRKMPKTFFNDLGLRNYFARDFSPLHLRNDNGALFENFVFRLLADRYDGSDIQFWRTQKMQEVDFIVENKHAFEVKYSPKQVNQKKYEFFTKAYPDIQFDFITFENVLEIMAPLMKINP
jgi:predicted AAA+ superfamily ATPase